MVIWLASYPRSGNTLARIVLKRLFGRPSSAIYTIPASAAALREFIGEVPMSGSLEEMAADADLHIVKTHEMPPPDDYPAIYLVRDGRDALVSYAHFILHTERGIAAGSDREAFLRVLRQIIASNDHFGGWGRNVLAWQQRKAPTATIRYEDLVAGPATALQEASASLGQRAAIRGGESMPSFEDLHSAFPWFFRKGQIGAWRDEMPADLQELFWQRHREAMALFGYE